MERTDALGWRLLACMLLAMALLAAAPSSSPATQINEFSSGLSGTPGAITAGPDGNVWFTSTGAIGRITPSGAISEFSAGLNPGSMPFDGIVTGSDGNLWFIDIGTTKAIGRITPSGAITEFSAGLNPGSAPESLVVGPDGNVWFLDLGTTKAIGRITPSGTISEFSAGLNPVSKPNDITAGPGGDVWFTDQGNTKAIGRVTPGGTITEFSNGLLEPASSFPVDITQGADGNLWFTDDGMPEAIGRVTPAGTISEFDAGLNPNSVPDSITAGPGGDVWFADQHFGQRAIGRVTPAGAITEFEAGLSSDLPDDIAPGADGNLWVAQSGAPPAIARVTASGAISEFTAGLSGEGTAEDEIVEGPDGNLWFTDEGTPKAIGRVQLQLAPAVSTGAATAVTDSKATVSASVNPLGSATTVAFEYGTTPALGSTMAAGALPASGTFSTVTATLSGLPAGSEIYYRALATNASGAGRGNVSSFRTNPVVGSSPLFPFGGHATTATFGNQQITLTTPSLSGCTARTSPLGASLSSATIHNSHAKKLRFLKAAIYIDKGVAHRHRKTRHLANGKKKTSIVVVYTANAAVHRLPATLHLRLAGVKSGTHTLRARLSYSETVTKQGHRRTVTVSKTLTAKFRVC